MRYLSMLFWTFVLPVIVFNVLGGVACFVAFAYGLYRVDRRATRPVRCTALAITKGR